MAWKPTPDDVGNLIARLTTDDSADITGKFTETTVPSFAQVENIIDGAYEDIAGRYTGLTGDSQITTALEGLAKSTVAWQAAYDVALSYYPQMDDLIDNLKDRVTLKRSDLQAGVDVSKGQDPDTGDGDKPNPATPAGWFPPAGCPWTW